MRIESQTTIFPAVFQPLTASIFCFSGNLALQTCLNLPFPRLPNSEPCKQKEAPKSERLFQIPWCGLVHKHHFARFYQWPVFVVDH